MQKKLRVTRKFRREEAVHRGKDGYKEWLGLRVMQGEMGTHGSRREPQHLPR